MSSVELENDGESDSSTDSRSGETSGSEYLAKYSKKNISLKKFKIMLVKDPSITENEAELTPEPEKDDKFSEVIDPASISDDKVRLIESPSIIDSISSDGNQVSDSGSTVYEFDGKVSIKEESFELHLDDDENIAAKRHRKSDLDNENKKSSSARKAKVDESLLSLNGGSSEKVRCRSYLSTDLENITIPDTIEDDYKKPIAAASIIASSESSSSPISQPVETEFNCAFCEKKWPTRNSLKFHVLSHLKSFLKQGGKENLEALSSEIDCVTAESTDGNTSSDFVCVFCEKSFTSKMTLKTHYRVDHAHKGSPQTQNRPLSTLATYSIRRQSGEPKMDTPIRTGQSVPISANESPATPSADENGVNDDGPKQYKCYMCDKQFARKSSLMWHIQFHETYMYSKLKKNNSELENGLSPGTGAPAESFPADGDHSFRCQVCGKTYESLSGYRRHVVNHGAVDEEAGVGEKCEFCNKYCPTAVGLKRHLIFMHKDQLASVEDLEDIAVEDSIDSISGSSVGDEYVCNICQRHFTHRNSYKRHMNLVHKMKPPEMAIARSKTVEDIDTNKDAEGEFSCDLCHRSFISRRAVSIHRAHGHRGEESVASDTVASDTVASDTLTGDMIPCDSYVEQDDGSFQCTVCDKIFDSRKGVSRHIGYHRSAMSAQTTGASDDNEDYESNDDDEEMEGSIPCPECGKTFRSIRGMRIHAFSHRETASVDENDDDDDNSESGFDCHICDETFSGYRSFKMHLSWHTRRGEEASVRPKNSAKFTRIPKPPASSVGKIHQCQHCPRWYTAQQALAGHMKIHQNEKGTLPARTSTQPSSSGGKTSQVMCKVCGQYFPSSSSLQIHTKLHIDEGLVTPTTSSGQPLTLEDTMECDLCGKCFMRKQDMAKHMRDHMNGAVTKENVDLNLFRCIYCPKSFVGRKSLNTHQILHTEARMALKRAADELQMNLPLAKRHQSNDREELINWDDMPAHQCEECDRFLSTKQSLQRHMEWHAKTRTVNGVNPPKEQNSMAPPPLPFPEEFVGTPFECFYCKISFRTKELLVEHTKIHESVPTVGPPRVVVNNLEALGEHAVVQCVEGGNEEYFVFEQREGEAFQCSECDMTHSDKLQMIAHMAYHVGQRWAGGAQAALIIKMDPFMLAPFQCVFCEERFVNKKFRTQHVLQRHGDAAFQCNSCKIVFLSKKKLAMHCRQHLVDSMYRCEHCLKCFTSKWFLKRHTRKKCAGKSSPERKLGLEFSTSNNELPPNDT